MATLVTRKDYFESAFEILATEGFKELKVVKLCTVTGVTTGSFYNYFRNMKDFVDQFLAAWRQQLTKQLIETAELVDDPAQRLHTLVELAVTVPHEAEAAIRAWSQVDPAVRATQAEVDELRLGLVRRAIRMALPDDPDVDHLAWLGLSIVIGIQQLQSPINVNEMRWALNQFNAMVLARAGLDPIETGPAPARDDFLPAARRYVSPSP